MRHWVALRAITAIINSLRERRIEEILLWRIDVQAAISSFDAAAQPEHQEFSCGKSLINFLLISMDCSRKAIRPSYLEFHAL